MILFSKVLGMKLASVTKASILYQSMHSDPGKKYRTLIRKEKNVQFDEHHERV